MDMNNTTTTGNPTAEDGYGPADTIRANYVPIGELNVGDTIKVPTRHYNVRTIAAFEIIDGHGECIILDDGMILSSRSFNKVTHILGNGLV